MTAAECIIKTLEKESRCLTFDELYGKAQPDCDWISFAEVLEGLVEQGKVLYTLQHEADAGYYKIAEYGSQCLRRLARKILCFIEFWMPITTVKKMSLQ